ncbi:MAG: Bax inhibitor-1/YccA family protein [Alphaproteobacteria bacterium]|nr:Bax inhibitor-1/YccA family protein [Alphaproteobacteria bacterium]
MRKNTSITANDGLRSYILKIFNYMTLGLIGTAAVAFLVMSTPALMGFFFGSKLMSWVSILAPLGFVIYLSARIHTMSPDKGRLMFFLYSALMGISMAMVFTIYPVANIVQAFLVSAGTFGAMSLYGYTTKRDLTGVGSFMYMGLIGVIIASIVSWFVASPMLYFIINIVTVVVFVGLTAYDMQKMKHIYASVGGSSDVAERAAIMGALHLYLDFINLFLAILRLMGGRRD